VNAVAGSHARGQRTRKTARSRARSGVPTQVEAVRLVPHTSCEMEPTRELPTTTARKKLRAGAAANGTLPRKTPKLDRFGVSAPLGAAELLLVIRYALHGRRMGTSSMKAESGPSAERSLAETRPIEAESAASVRLKMRGARANGTSARGAVKPGGIAVFASLGAAEILPGTRSESCADWAGRNSMTGELERRTTFDFACTRPPEAEFAAKAHVKPPFAEAVRNAWTLEPGQQAAVFPGAANGRSERHRPSPRNHRPRGPLAPPLSPNCRQGSSGSARTRSQILQNIGERRGRATRSGDSYASAGGAGRFEQDPATRHFGQFPPRVYQRPGQGRPSVSEPAAPGTSRRRLPCQKVACFAEAACHVLEANPEDSARNDWETASEMPVGIGILAN
jgi:hypothetical protein